MWFVMCWCCCCVCVRVVLWMDYCCCGVCCVCACVRCWWCWICRSVVSYFVILSVRVCPVCVVRGMLAGVCAVCWLIGFVFGFCSSVWYEYLFLLRISVGVDAWDRSWVGIACLLTVVCCSSLGVVACFVYVWSVVLRWCLVCGYMVLALWCEFKNLMKKWSRAPPPLPRPKNISFLIKSIGGPL